jgi:hypothetical protein
MLCICGEVHEFGSNSNKSELHSEDVKSRLNSGIVRYNSVQNILSFCLLYTHLKNEIYSFTCCEFTTWSLSLRQDGQGIEHTWKEDNIRVGLGEIGCELD